MRVFKSSLPIVILLIGFIVYFSTKIENTPYDYFIRLAQSFMQGRLYLTENPPWLNELVKDPVLDRWYVVYPPTPALVAIPFILLSQHTMSQTMLSVIFGAVNVLLVYLVINRIYHSQRIASIAAIAWGFGTSHWFLTTEGSSWYISHIFAVFFLLLSILISRIYDREQPFSTKRWFLTGLCIGFAYWARLPTILAIIWFIGIIMLTPQPPRTVTQLFLHIRSHWRPIFSIIAGATIFIVLNTLYNLARFGTFNDIAYERIDGVLNEPWYRYGIFSIRYIPENVWYFLSKLPLPHSEFPFIKPSIEGMSFFLTSPFFILLPFIRWRNVYTFTAFLTAWMMLIPIFAHGGIGFTQFGFRYATEAAVFFLIAWCSVLNRRYVSYIAIFLVLVAVIINYWGIYFIRELELYGW